MKKSLYYFALLLPCFSTIFGQETGEKIDHFSKDTIQGVYIPKDLEDCFRQIDKFWNDSTKLKVSSLTEDEFSTDMHFGLGMWIRNNWQLWGGSRLSKYFNDMGIFHPDDISGIILTSYYRQLFKRDIKLGDQIEYYKDYWTKLEEEEKEKNKEYLEYEIGDTVMYNYLLGFASRKQKRDYFKKKCIAKGIITDKNNDNLLIKVRIIKSCVEKGIIYFDNEKTVVYNEKTQKLERPDRREIKYLKNGMENWFEYLNWEQIKNN